MEILLRIELINIILADINQKADDPQEVRQQIYTGLTRAKPRDTNDKVIIVSNKEVFLQAIVKKVERESGLALMLAK